VTIGINTINLTPVGAYIYLYVAGLMAVPVWKVPMFTDLKKWRAEENNWT